MKNVNRDFLVTVYAKTAEIIPPKEMKFYITDILTCNIFFQLVFNDSGNLVNSYAPNEDASNYTLTLRVVKPNNEPKEIEAVLLNQGSNFFYVDLTPDFIDILGFYECELFIDTEINGRAERSTTDPFQYEVEKSIFTNLNEVIEGDPNYSPIIDTLATKDYVINAIENMDLTNYATRNYVNEAIADISLTDYATKDYVNEAISNIEPSYDIDLSEYIWIGTQDEYEAIGVIDPNVLYFIQEDEV